MELTGYRQAVIHLAWFRDDKVQHLLFGMVELRPIELPDAVGCLLTNCRAKRKSRKYLHYRRFVLPAADAIDWYQNATRGNPIILPGDPSHPTKGDGAALQPGAFVQEPPWPHFVTSNDLVFAPDWMNDSRIHFLYRQDALPTDVCNIIQVPKNREMLEEWLNFDIVDAYSEYQGALCLVAPNPVFRSIEQSHLEQPRARSAETVAYKLVARQGQCLNGLRLEIVNERLRGRMAPLVRTFGSEAIEVFNFPVEIYKEGRSVTHPEHGLLYWHQPFPLIRSVQTRIGLIQRRKRIEVPAAGRRRPAYEYEVNEVDDLGETVRGGGQKDIFARLVGGEERRQRQKNGKRIRSRMVLSGSSRSGTIHTPENRRCTRYSAHC